MKMTENDWSILRSVWELIGYDGEWEEFRARVCAEDLEIERAISDLHRRRTDNDDRSQVSRNRACAVAAQLRRLADLLEEPNTDCP